MKKNEIGKMGPQKSLFICNACSYKAKLVLKWGTTITLPTMKYKPKTFCKQTAEQL